MKILIKTFTFILFLLSVHLSYADPATLSSLSKTGLNYRLKNLTSEDKRLFEALSPEQRQLIQEGKIDKGFNEWMVKLAWGQPYYATEHHPIFVDYEQVWLYTKPQINEDVKETQILDAQNNNWPTIHRITTKKTCIVGDTFILWDRGVVESSKPIEENKIYGSCTIQTEEAFLPIVNGKPVEPKR